MAPTPLLFRSAAHPYYDETDRQLQQPKPATLGRLAAIPGLIADLAPPTP